MPQISRAYSEMVRSLENLPQLPMLRITILVHPLGSCEGPPDLSWFISMLTMSLKRSGWPGLKKPPEIWSMACFSSGMRL
ncbi:hypothetical protein CRUP_029761 [Coryphaenoides rupestris]|nr:hypothetical protein CRUP_029761 [Coryphaenoides rupestris]